MGKVLYLEFVRDPKESNFLNRICREAGSKVYNPFKPMHLKQKRRLCITLNLDLVIL